MRIVAARWIPYRLPLRRPWASAGGSLERREGWLLRLTTDDGRTGWGDCAPFPEIGIGPTAATACARECALLDLAAQAADLPVAAWLRGGKAASDIPVNAALGDIQALAPAAIEAACAQGFQVLKIKVGRGDPADDVARLRELAAALPAGVRLRLDANQAWPESTAAGFLAACAELPVDGVEEPLRDPQAEALRRLQAILPFPLAVDESFERLQDGFFARPPVRRLILKLPRHGGLLSAARLALAARAAGMECVVTSSLESACGLAAAAHLAAAVAPAATHGLATAHWFAEDTGSPPVLANGRLCLPPRAGLGFLPHIS